MRPDQGGELTAVQSPAHLVPAEREGVERREPGGVGGRAAEARHPERVPRVVPRVPGLAPQRDGDQSPPRAPATAAAAPPSNPSPSRSSSSRIAATCARSSRSPWCVARATAGLWASAA
jgi:hypothetical protein